MAGDDDVISKEARPLFGLSGATHEDVPRPNPLGLRSAAECAEPPAPVPWLCKQLHLAPGRPVSLSGYAGTGKTNVAAALALGVAAGLPTVLGLRLDRHGDVLLVDHECGSRSTHRRLYRLAIGLRVDLREVGERLQWVSYPKLTLVQEGAEELLLEVCQGKALVVIDSLKRLLPGVDENDARVADHLAILARVSEATGCTFVLLQHEGKPGADGAREARFRGRGSSAIQGEWSSHWSISVQGEGAGRHLLLEHGKSEHGQLLKPMRLRFVDVGRTLDDGQAEGLRLEAVGDEGADGRPLEQGTAVPAGALVSIQRQMVDYLRAVGEVTYGDLLKGARGKTESKTRAVRDLVEGGQVVKRTIRNGRSTVSVFSLAGQRDGVSRDGETVENGENPGYEDGSPFPGGETS